MPPFHLFSPSIYGESHGTQVGVLITGCPAGIPLSEDDFLPDLARRKSGAKGTTPRLEADLPKFLSGVYNGYTTGSPINIGFENTNTRSGDYANLLYHPRPGHADFTAGVKYNNYQDPRGGGHFSGRLTLGVVAAGVIAKKVLPESMHIEANILSIGGKTDWEELLENCRRQGDSVGAIIECRVVNPISGLGEPFWDSVESVLSHAIFSIPGIRGIEFGSGFQAAEMFGSQHNDRYINAQGLTETNHSSGILGGITSGNDIVFRVAVKPTASISLPQDTYNFKENKVSPLIIHGRHDTCIALRMPVIIEAMTAITLCDLYLQKKARQ